MYYIHKSYDIVCLKYWIKYLLNWQETYFSICCILLKFNILLNVLIKVENVPNIALLWILK